MSVDTEPLMSDPLTHLDPTSDANGTYLSSLFDLWEDGSRGPAVAEAAMARHALALHKYLIRKGMKPTWRARLPASHDRRKCLSKCHSNLTPSSAESFCSDVEDEARAIQGETRKAGKSVLITSEYINAQ